MFISCSNFQSAVDWDYKEKVEKHGSQRDYSSGFGGKYGVQVDRQDKSAVGWDHVEKLEKHESQKGNKKSIIKILLSLDDICEKISKLLK